MSKKQTETPEVPEEVTTPEEVQEQVDEQVHADKEDGKVTKKEDKPEKKGKFTFWKNKRISALTILVRGGKDDLGQEGVKEKVRFEPYYDTWKGDVVRVGYLKTDSEEVAKRCEEDNYCEKITEKEYNLAVEGDDENKPLRRAPIQQV